VSQTLTLLEGRYAVCRLEPGAGVPAEALAGPFWAAIRTEDELSIVCEQERAPAGVRAEPGWRVFRLEGPFSFRATGILASVADPLARAGVGIFAVSTYDTDYVLVKQEQVEAAWRSLEDAGHSVRKRGAP
jgi:uncharacterized protein